MPDIPHNPDSFTPEEYNQYILAQIKIPLSDKEVISMVKWRKRDTNGKPVGISNKIPLLYTRLYKVELHGGAVEELSVNTISENLWAQCNENGFMYQILDKKIDHCTNNQAISTDDAYIKTPSVQKLYKTTIGWELYFQ